MLGQFLPLVRQRVDAASTLKWGLLLGVIYALTRNGALIAGLLTMVLVTETVDILETLPGVDERWVKVGLGGVVLVASGVWLWGVLQESTAARRLWLPVVAIAGSLWVLLDARADFVQDRRFDSRRFANPETDADLSVSEVLLLSQHVHLVANALRTGPKTVDELATECDLTESRVREAITIAGRDRTIYPVDSEPESEPELKSESESKADNPRYTLDDRKMGLSGFGWQTAGGVKCVGRRLIRPFVEQF